MLTPWLISSCGEAAAPGKVNYSPLSSRTSGSTAN